jgi:hypothetical protein
MLFIFGVSCGPWFCFLNVACNQLMCTFCPFNQVPNYFFFIFAFGVAYGILPLFVVCISPFTFVQVASANGATFKMQLDNFTQQEIDVFLT